MTYSRYGCFPLVSPRAALTQFPPRKPIPAEGHAPAGPLSSRDTFDPMRTDTGRIQPCRTTAQVFARRVLKCCNDNWVPLDVNATHLRTRMCGHRRQPVLSQEQTTCMKQERVNWIVFNKCLPGWWMNCVENSSQMQPCGHDIRSSVCKEPVKSQTAHVFHTSLSLM